MKDYFYSIHHLIMSRHKLDCFLLCFLLQCVFWFPSKHIFVQISFACGLQVEVLHSTLFGYNIFASVLVFLMSACVILYNLDQTVTALALLGKIGQ